MPTETERPSPALPQRSFRWPAFRFFIFALLLGWFVFSHLSDPLRRDPRGLVLLFLLTPPFVYTGLSLGRRLSGKPISAWWRVLFLILGLVAVMPAWRLVATLAEANESRVIRRAFEPALVEVRSRRARSGRPPVEMEEIARRHLPDISKQGFRFRSFSYYFGDREWALQASGVPLDRDDTTSITITADGRTFRHDSGVDGGVDASQQLLLAELPFLAQARSCLCRVGPGEGGGNWVCTPPCGTWRVEELVPQSPADSSPPPSPSPSPSINASPRADARPSSTPPGR